MLRWSLWDETTLASHAQDPALCSSTFPANTRGTQNERLPKGDRSVVPWGRGCRPSQPCGRSQHEQPHHWASNAMRGMTETIALPPKKVTKCTRLASSIAFLLCLDTVLTHSSFQTWGAKPRKMARNWGFQSHSTCGNLGWASFWVLVVALLVERQWYP